MKPLFPNLRRPPHRPVLHGLIAAYLAFMTWVGARIWMQSLASGVLNVRGPALVRDAQPDLYWLAMAGAAVTLAVVGVGAVLGLRALALNLVHGKRT